MSFTATTPDQGCGPRCGELQLQSNSISTPSFLFYTYRGGVVNLTNDLVESINHDGQLIGIDALHFVPNMKLVKSCPGGVKQLLALPSNLPAIITTRDPCTYEYSGPLRQSTDEWASVGVHSGGATLTPTDFIDLVAALKPDAYVVLSDDVPCDCKHDRAVKSATRTVQWLEKCLAARSLIPQLATTPVFATIQGGAYIEERKKCAQAIVNGPYASEILGFVVGGIATAESREHRQEILQAVLQGIPSSAVRMVTGVGTIDEVLQAVEQGVDLFDTGYSSELANAGYALCFPIADGEVENANSNGTYEDSDSDSGARDDIKMNLWAAAYKTDTRPFVIGCGCPSCSRPHTRAYVHHLLHAHEMTANVLLEAHNTWHYARFFTAMREAITRGKFAEFRDRFLDRKAEWLNGES